jgi:7-cyano-7-deazaguanine synthase in queuosine biosynthesis
MKEVILFSGGCDSLVGWFYMQKPELLHVQIDHRYAKLEEKAVAALSSAMPELFDKLRHCEVLSDIGRWEKPDAEIPARNLLLAVAAAQMGYDRIGLVCQADERSIPDRSIEFFERTCVMLSSLFGRTIELEPVFTTFDKTDMISWFLQDKQACSNNASWSTWGTPPTSMSREERINLLKKTVACYTPIPGQITHHYGLDEVVHRQTAPSQCGACPACFRRAIAFTLNGVEEEYAVDPWSTDVAKLYAQKALSGHYSAKRSVRILDALAKHGKISSKGFVEVS